MLNENTHERRSFRAIGNVFKPIRGLFTNSSMSINSDHHSDSTNQHNKSSRRDHHHHSSRDNDNLTNGGTHTNSPSKGSKNSVRPTISRPQSHGPPSDTLNSSIHNNGTQFHHQNNGNNDNMEHYGNFQPQQQTPQYAPPHMHQQQFPTHNFTHPTHNEILYGHHIAPPGPSVMSNSSNDFGPPSNMMHTRRSPGDELTVNQSRTPIVAGDSLTIPPPKPQRMILQLNQNGFPDGNLGQNGFTSANSSQNVPSQTGPHSQQFPPPPPRPPLATSSSASRPSPSNSHSQHNNTGNHQNTPHIPTGLQHFSAGMHTNNISGHVGINSSPVGIHPNGPTGIVVQQVPHQNGISMTQHLSQVPVTTQNGVAVNNRFSPSTNPTNRWSQPPNLFDTYGTISAQNQIQTQGQIQNQSQQTHQQLVRSITSSNFNPNTSMPCQYGPSSLVAQPMGQQQQPERPYSVMGVPGSTSSLSRRNAYNNNTNSNQLSSLPISLQPLAQSQGHVHVDKIQAQQGQMISQSQNSFDSQNQNGTSNNFGMVVNNPLNPGVAIINAHGQQLQQNSNQHQATAALVVNSVNYDSLVKANSQNLNGNNSNMQVSSQGQIQNQMQNQGICESIYGIRDQSVCVGVQNQNQTQPHNQVQGQRLLDMEQRIEQLTGLVLKVLSPSSSNDTSANLTINSSSVQTNGSQVSAASNSGNFQKNSSDCSAQSNSVIVSSNPSSSSLSVSSGSSSSKEKARILNCQIKELKREIKDLNSFIGNQMEILSCRLSSLVVTSLLNNDGGIFAAIGESFFMQREKFQLLDNEIFQLESRVERLRDDAINRRCRVKMRELNEMARVINETPSRISNLQETLANLRQQLFDSCESAHRDSQSIDQQLSRLDELTKRSKKIANILVTLRRLASAQEQRISSNVADQSSADHQNLNQTQDQGQTQKLLTPNGESNVSSAPPPQQATGAQSLTANYLNQQKMRSIKNNYY